MAKRLRQWRIVGRSCVAGWIALALVVVSAGTSVSSALAESPPRVAAGLSLSAAKQLPPPVPVITETPASVTYATSAHFEFVDQGQRNGFQCRLDKASFASCGPAGISYYNLAFGRHCFEVLAVLRRFPSAPASFCWRCRPAVVQGGLRVGAGATRLFYPGVSQPLDLAIANNFKFAIKVLSVSITVGPVPTKDGLPDPGCPGTVNLLVTRALGTTVVVPARSTESLSDLGVPQDKWPVLTMPDLPTNQDACEGATFTVLYSGTATPYSKTTGSS